MRITARATFLVLIIGFTGSGVTFGQEPHKALTEQCCKPEPTVWASGEYLLWWIKDGPLHVPLLTTAPDASGAIGASLFGGHGIDYDRFAGGRLVLGSWLEADQSWGIEGRGFLLEQRSVFFRAASNATGTPEIDRSFFDLLTGQAFPFSTTFPGDLAGGAAISSSSRLWGAEANLLGRLWQREQIKVHALTGLRYARLDENLAIREQARTLNDNVVSFLGTDLPAGTVLADQDRFDARNQFFGGQLGLRTEYTLGCWSLHLDAKVALGSNHQVVNVAGISTVQGGGSASGGVLAIPSNSGRFVHDAFSVMPEIDLRLGYALTSRATAFVGYNYLYWTEVARPGDQIQTRNGLALTNRSQIPTSAGFGMPGPSGPRGGVGDGGFWAQGINFGLEWRF